ncbi:MAG: hypothetical protein AAF799_22570 [Myxococcota bacterium]
MLTFRPRQLEDLSHNLKLDFEVRLRDHLRRAFPGPVRRMSREALDEFVRGGVTRALEYGLTTERDACKLVSAMFVLGRDFDQQPWAREILRGTRVHRRLSKIDLLLREAMHRESSTGVDDVRQAG